MNLKNKFISYPSRIWRRVPYQHKWSCGFSYSLFEDLEIRSEIYIDFILKEIGLDSYELICPICNNSLQTTSYRELEENINLYEIVHDHFKKHYNELME